MDIENLMPDNRPSTKYALLTPSAYESLNKAISERLGFDVSQATERYTTITAPVTDAGLMVMQITVEVQEKCADLLPDLVELNSWTLAEQQPKELICEGLTTEQVDWVITHTELTNPDLEVLYLLDQPPSQAVEPAIQSLVNRDITVIIADNEN